MVLMSVSNDEAGDFRSKPRWSANRKIDVVLRLLRGESLEDVSREVGVEAHRLAAWPDDFFGVGQAGSETEASPGRGGPAPLGGGTQDRRGDGGGGDLAAGGRKKGASDPAAEAAEIAAEGPFPLARVCEVLGASRSTVYHRRLRGDALGRRPGPLTDIADDQLTELIRRVIADSPFAGEGYRKVRARLRRQHGIGVGGKRVLRLMRLQGLLAPQRARGRRRPHPHDGTIIPDGPNLRWGTDATMAWTRLDGWVWVFANVDHWSAEAWTHVAKTGDRIAALQPVYDAVIDRFGGLGPDVARGISLRHDWGPQYRSKHFLGSIAW